MSRKHRKAAAPAIKQAPMARASAQARRFTTDSFQNFAARVGIGTDNQSSGGSYGFDFISRNRVQMEAMYRSSWIVGAVVDCVAEDMTRAGVSISCDLDPDDLKSLEQGMERMQIWDALCDTTKWGRLYGGAIAVMLIDGQRMETPLNVDSIGEGQFKGLLVLDRWLVQPSLDNLVTELGPDLGKPKFYDVVADSMALKRERIHYSRVLRIDGVDLPYWQRISENLWGQSVIERLFDRLLAFDSTTQGVAQLVYKAHLRTLKVDKLREIIATGGPAFEGLVKQVDMIRRFQTNEGLTLLDASDEFQVDQCTFAGLDDVLLQMAQQLSGASEIPLTRLFGQSPAGLNATGDGEMKQYHEGINTKQERRLRMPLTRLLEVMARSVLGAAMPKGWSFTFNSLQRMSDTEKSAIGAQTTAAIVDTYESGLVDQATSLKELKQASDVTGLFTNITDEMITEAENAPPPIEGEAGGGGDADKPSSDADQGPETGAFSFNDEWNESQHPRKDNGEFGEGSGSDGSSKHSLTANEKTALSSYSGDDFLRINAELRKGDASDPSVKRIDQAIAKSSLHDGTVLYRGMNREAAKQLFPNGEIKAGSTISDKAFVSTSRSEDIGRMLSGGGVMLKIESGKGAKGLDMDQFSRNKHEKEVLLPRDSKMIVRGVIPPKKPGDPVIVRVSYE